MISRPKLIVWSVAALGSAGITYLLLAEHGELASLRRDMAKLARDAETHRRAEAPKKELPLPSWESRAPVEQRPAAPAGVSIAPPVAPPADSTEPSGVRPRNLTPEEEAFERQQQNEQIASQLDSVLDADVADSLGEGVIRHGFSALRDASAANSVRSVECGSRMCRVVVVSNDGDAQVNLGHQLSGHEPFNHGAFYHYDLESTPPTTTIYVAMNGAELGSLAR